MVATINEHTQYFDATTNTPIVNGNIYIGARNGDPRVPIPIFSDRELTTPLLNPQATDAAGRSVNKIWIPDRYSIEVTNSNDVRRYIQTDVGESSSASVINLGNVQGANAITATGTPTITSYVDQAQFTFKTVQINTDAMTLNVDGIGVKPIVKNKNKPIQPGNFEAFQIAILTYNSTSDSFEWTNQNIKATSSYKGTVIASATTITIPTDGSYFEVTGSTDIENFLVAANRIFILRLASGSVTIYQSTALNTVQVVGTPGSGLGSTQVFTSSDTWIHPDGLLRAEIIDVAAGGGGGGTPSNNNVGGAGGGGGTAFELIEAADLGSTETVTIGAGGIGGIGSNPGTQGGTSSFGAHNSATGGAGGINNGGDGGIGGVGVGGDTNIEGGGGTGNPGSDGSARGPAGGSSTLGGGATGRIGNGLNGGNYGGGGAGGGGNGGSSTDGGNGADGIIIVKEYF